PAGCSYIPPGETGSVPQRVAKNGALSHWNNGEIDEASRISGAVNSLRCLHVILRLGEEDVRNEGLRITVIKRKPTGLNLNHDAMPRQKHMVCRRQHKFIWQRLVGRQCRRSFETLAITPAENIHRNAKFITAEFRL